MQNTTTDLTTDQTKTLTTIVKEKKSTKGDYDGRTINALTKRELVKTCSNKSGWVYVTATAKGRKALN